MVNIRFWVFVMVHNLCHTPMAEKWNQPEHANMDVLILTSFCKDNVLFKGVRDGSQVWMSHGDTITAIPDNFKKIASTDKVEIRCLSGGR